MFFRISRLGKTWLLKCLNGHVSEHPFKVSMLKDPKRGLDLHDIPFKLLFNQYERNSVGKRLSDQYLKS